MKKPQLSYEGLNFQLEKLSSILQQPWIFTLSFKDLSSLWLIALVDTEII